jgi:hypothetical protein
MKFLCVPCDSPMKLQTIGPPERGSLSVVYSCPECGYEMAMLTNAYETQVVQSLGVRIGPGTGEATSSTSGTGCPFTAMMPATEGAPTTGPGQPGVPDARTLRGGVEAGVPMPVRWTAAAEARLANIPAFVRPMARTGIETFARERGAIEVDEKILDAARDFFGM